MPPKFGRRAGGVDSGNIDDAAAGVLSQKIATEADRQRLPDEVVYKDKLHNLDDGVDGQAHEQTARQAVEEKEQLVKRIAEAPVGYTHVMPKLAELDLSSLWNDFLSTIHQDFDISALTSCLSQQLDDEDVTWNPDMLLVQLTSDMLDAAESGDNAPLASDPAALEATSEARRQHKKFLENADEVIAPTRGRRHRSSAGVEGQATPENASHIPFSREAGEMASSEHPEKHAERTLRKESHRNDRELRAKDPTVGAAPTDRSTRANAPLAGDANRKTSEKKAKEKGSRTRRSVSGRSDLPTKAEKK
ncbi:hypothetical protein TraAM80_04350 [Trypanosoma rangeli]|uniref:Intraflagellar transport protein 43 n=1 Tax=Trypanosoma rangeli TaxID=5698 RepID=A0A422NJR5_TRYRA|nr:uncharacterized protein TraAM80_04350 [Trypanosoma rangeli]RNF05715.1 hypothetical protein TraAM80_04350 [Trypanosoma rangeli]|eukprot:RNF05715.1 hypothetical protein TraAM80_04350 [Trypanosoma rangeli]